MAARGSASNDSIHASQTLALYLARHSSWNLYIFVIRRYSMLPLSMNTLFGYLIFMAYNSRTHSMPNLPQEAVSKKCPT